MSNFTGVVSRVFRFGLRLTQFKSPRTCSLISSKLYHHCFVPQKSINCRFPYIFVIGFIPRRQAAVMSALSPNDPASYSRPDLAVIRHIDLKLDVDFDQKVLSGSALLKFEALQDVDEVILDASNLTIRSVELENGTALKYKLSEHVPNFGSKLTVNLPHSVQPVDKNEQLDIIAHGNLDLHASKRGVTFSELEKDSQYHNTPKIKREPHFTLSEFSQSNTYENRSKENLLRDTPEIKDGTTFNNVKSTPLVTTSNDKNENPKKFNTIPVSDPRANKSNEKKLDSSYDIFENAESYFIAIATRNKKVYDIFEPAEKYFMAAQNEVLESKDDKSGDYNLKKKNRISETYNKFSEDNRNAQNEVLQSKDDKSGVCDLKKKNRISENCNKCSEDNRNAQNEVLESKDDKSGEDDKSGDCDLKKKNRISENCNKFSEDNRNAQNEVLESKDDKSGEDDKSGDYDLKKKNRNSENCNKFSEDNRNKQNEVLESKDDKSGDYNLKKKNRISETYNKFSEDNRNAQNEVLQSKDDKSGVCDLKKKNRISENCNKFSEDNRNAQNEVLESKDDKSGEDDKSGDSDLKKKNRISENCNKCSEDNRNAQNEVLESKDDKSGEDDKSGDCDLKKKNRISENCNKFSEDNRNAQNEVLESKDDKSGEDDKSGDYDLKKKNRNSENCNKFSEDDRNKQNEVLESKDDKCGNYKLKQNYRISENCIIFSEDNKNLEGHHKSSQAGNLLEDNKYKHDDPLLDIKENTTQTCKIVDFNSDEEILKIPEEDHVNICDCCKLIGRNTLKKESHDGSQYDYEDGKIRLCNFIIDEAEDNFTRQSCHCKLTTNKQDYVDDKSIIISNDECEEERRTECTIIKSCSSTDMIDMLELCSKRFEKENKMKNVPRCLQQQMMSLNENSVSLQDLVKFLGLREPAVMEHCNKFNENCLSSVNLGESSCLKEPAEMDYFNKVKDHCCYCRQPAMIQHCNKSKENCVSSTDLFKTSCLQELAEIDDCNLKDHCCHFGERDVLDHCNKFKENCVSSADFIQSSCCKQCAVMEDCNKLKDHYCYCGQPTVIEFCQKSKENCVSSIDLIKSPCLKEPSLVEHCTEKYASSTDFIKFSCLRIEESAQIEHCDKLKKNCVSPDLSKFPCLKQPAETENCNKLRESCCYCASSTGLVKPSYRKESAVIEHCNKFKENCVSSTDFVKFPCLKNPIVIKHCNTRRTCSCNDLRIFLEEQTKVLDDMLKCMNARMTFIEENCEILENQQAINQHNPIERLKICVCGRYRCSRESIQMVDTPVAKKPQPDSSLKINCNFQINFMLETLKNISVNEIHSSTGTVQDDKTYVVTDGQHGHNFHSTNELYMSYKIPNNFLKNSESEITLNLYTSQSEDNSDNNNNAHVATTFSTPNFRENYIIASGPISYEKRFNIRIKYRTAPSASALQWLDPMQTSGKKYPYLFSQCQPIHARSILPCQDSPAVKFTYNAEISAPAPFTVLMSALSDERSANKSTFHQPVPIPSYLLALAVGVLESRTIGPRSKVWSEHAEIEKSAWEFAETENYLKAAEKMCGPYVWKQYDLLVLPPSFPYGGMENPCLTFVTPSLLAGDRSQADVIVHEIMHSWTGNLVTNTNFEHFWLNEGFTVFLERKVAASLIGNATEAKKSRDFQSLLGLQELSEAVNSEFDPTSPLTCMVVNLAGVHPDEAFSTVPYEKGSTFLRYLEDIIGIEVFDDFIRSYLNQFQKQSLDTNQFKTYLLDYFEDTPHGEKLAHVDWKAWLYTPGMPPIIPDYDTSMTKDVTNLLAKIESGNVTFSPKDIKGFTPHQIINFLQELIDRPPLPTDQLEALGAAYNVANSQNSEIKYRWLRLCVRSKHITRLPEVFHFLNHYGRMKYVRPIYRDLYAWEDVRKQSIKNFIDNESNMMHVSAYTVRKDLHLSDPILNV